MSLREYRRKRDFRKTTEPRGRRAIAGGTKPRFVVQKHDASHLHYDFRLELDGVLKSWAVPKGPSLDPSEKRLAVHVEDHPLEYGDFEGVIPQGEYGGGTVMLWDSGVWQAIGDAEAGYRDGKLKFELFGKKLRGGWVLVRSGGAKRDPRQWLLIKERDEFARAHDDFDVTIERPQSVKSRRDLQSIAAQADQVWSAKPVARGSKHAHANGRSSRASAKKKLASLPRTVAAQLATLVESAPSGDEWFHEIKFDGYRMLAYVNHGKVVLRTRNDQDWTARFPTIAAALAKLKVKQAILDGEIVALDDQGRSEFQRLQEALHEGNSSSLAYFVFDLLWLDGRDLRPLSLAERKQQLESLRLPVERGSVRYVEHIVGNGAKFFAEAERHGLEGIICKRSDRPYVGRRTSDWLKVKTGASAEFVILGYTAPAGSRQGFGALLLGYHDDAGALQYAGRVGTGFDDQLLRSLHRRLKRLKASRSPLADGAVVRSGTIQWVRPELVAQIRFSNWTRDGLLRHPVFLGLREDKPAASVQRETAKPLPRVKPAMKSKTVSKQPSASRRAISKDATGSDVNVAGVRLTHPDKLYYPRDGISKRQLAEYYLLVADWMLPHVVNRPLSIVRCPDGIEGPRFFQKHPSAGMLETLSRVRVREKAGPAEYVMVRDRKDLVSLVQVGSLELHAWGSRADDLDRPDQIVFDLDPADDVPWAAVVDGAREIRQLLEDLGLVSFVKTSGGKGLHVVAPIARRHEWPFVKQFARGVAMAVAKAAPDRYIATMSKAARGGKIFIDYLRNERGATTVVPYSTRAKAGAPISWPVDWTQLSRVKSAAGYTLADARRRLSTMKNDSWAALELTRQSLSEKMLKRLTLDE